jgi:hypothetical protein
MQQTLLGFTFMEVLMTLCLFSILFFVIGKSELVVFNAHQNAYFETLATVQLQNISELTFWRIANFSNFYREWNRENQFILPGGRGEMILKGSMTVFRLYWRSVIKHGLWRCQVKPIAHQACLEMRLHRFP